MDTTHLVPNRRGKLDGCAAVSEPLCPDMGEDSPLGSTRQRGVSGLPAAVSSFVGREHETKAGAELLETARLVTLIRVAGVGKTRLALAVAAAVAERYADRVWLVELAPVADPALVPAAVAAVLGVREQPGQTLAKTLASRLRYRSLLLVVDNCEHLLDAVAELVEALLHACPDLRVLATSREPLRIVGEQTWPVPPLPLPPADLEGSKALSSWDATRLFAERAAAVEPGFALTAAVAPAVAVIYRRLDGLPLAIELAAARVRVLSPAEIAARLDDRFALLTNGGRTAAPRQQSLQAALGWSHDLLSEVERVVLRRLSVFAADCTLEAAEQVCMTEDLALEQVVDLLAGLVTKSLLVADTCGAQARYRLLETIRQYGTDRLLESGEAEILRDRHAAWCVRLAEQAEPELTSSGQAAWLERLDAEHANLRVALEWSVASGSVEQVLRLGGALTLFWLIRGHLSEGRAWLEQALAASPDAPPVLRAKALWGLGLLAAIQGDVAAVAAGEESLALARQAGDPQVSARALYLLGLFAVFHDPLRARTLLEQSVTFARQADDLWCAATALGLMGWASMFQGDLTTAHRLLEDCRATAHRAHDKQSLCISLQRIRRISAS